LDSFRVERLLGLAADPAEFGPRASATKAEMQPNISDVRWKNNNAPQHPRIGYTLPQPLVRRRVARHKDSRGPSLLARSLSGG